MSRWWIGFVAVLIACVSILLNRATSPSLLEDSDTVGILQGIEKRQSPLSWFGSDWPLENHFYRPISTLTFEADHLLHGSDAAGFGLTNALLACLSVLGAYIAVLCLTRRVGVAFAVSLWFLLANLNVTQRLPWLFWLVPLGLVTCLLPRRRFELAVIAASVAWFAAGEFQREPDLYYRMIGWIPGRTASTMTLFALIAVALHAHAIWVSSRPEPLPETSTDIPATKSSIQTELRPTAALWCSLGSLICLILALGSYEQAVTVPVVMLLTWGCFRLHRFRPALWPVLASFGILIGYVLLRTAILGTEVSRYQDQQFRASSAVFWSWADYALPGLFSFWSNLRAWVGFEGLLLPGPWTLFLGLTGTIVTLIVACKRFRSCPAAQLTLYGWVASSIAFAPMAFLKHFDHYHYLPMALRSLTVVGALWMFAKTWVSAASLPSVQAPQRHDPAPGSLPRR